MTAYEIRLPLEYGRDAEFAEAGAMWQVILLPHPPQNGDRIRFCEAHVATVDRCEFRAGESKVIVWLEPENIAVRSQRLGQDWCEVTL